MLPQRHSFACSLVCVKFVRSLPSSFVRFPSSFVAKFVRLSVGDVCAPKVVLWFVSRQCVHSIRSLVAGFFV